MRNIKWKYRLLTILVLTTALIFTACGGAASVEDAMKETASYLMENAEGYDVNDPASAWIVLAVANDSYADTDGAETMRRDYGDNVRAVVMSQDGILSDDEVTIYERTVIAMHAIGQDPTDVDGVDLTKPLHDVDKARAQGINAEIYALIAAHASGAELPDADAYRRDILDSIGENGAIRVGVADSVDMTGAALQALSYAESDAKVQAAVEKMKHYLSEQQGDSGGYATCEETAQAIIGLSMVGVDVETDRDFIRTDHTLVDGLMAFRSNEGFAHEANGETNLMASYQALLALDQIQLAGDKRNIYGE